MVEGIPKVTPSASPDTQVIEKDQSKPLIVYLGRTIVLIAEKANKAALVFIRAIRELLLSFGYTISKASSSLFFWNSDEYTVHVFTAPAPSPWKTFKARIRKAKYTSQRVEHLAHKKLPVAKKALNSGISYGGNTCYIASSLQCLRFIPSFRNRLNSKEMKASLFGQEMKRLFAILDGKNKEPPRSLTVTEINDFREFAKKEGWQPEHSTFAQQDTEEFCRFLFDKLAFPTFTYKHKIAYDFPISLRAFEKNDFPATYLSLGLEQDLENKELKEIATARKVVEPIEKKDISIDISTALEESLTEELIEKVERIQDIERLETLHTIQLHPDDIPHVLPIHLKRYNNKQQKLTTKILPSDILDLPLVDAPDMKARYKLVSMTVHDGASTCGGHHRAYIPIENRGKKAYLEYSDARTTLRPDTAKVEEDMSNNGLLYFYEFVGVVNASFRLF